ncbi:MAG: zinc ribbon domain-containing protein [Dehalococcoidia bacterium]
MPLYSYLCQACGKKFDHIRRTDDREHATCPDCGANADLQPAEFSFQFKGKMAGSGEHYALQNRKPART